MSTTPETPAPAPRPRAPEDVDFADEAGPKDTEFKKKEDAKEITSGDFDPIP